MKRYLLIIAGIIFFLYFIYILYINVISNPIKRISIEQVNSIQLQNTIYNIKTDKEFISKFVFNYNKAKVSKNQQLDTTPDFMAIVYLINGDEIIIYDGDTTYFYVKHKDNTTVYNGSELVRFLEEWLHNQGNT